MIMRWEPVGVVKVLALQNKSQYKLITYIETTRLSLAISSLWIQK
jgi:hypothetical protein